jgi:hypothetical protein
LTKVWHEGLLHKLQQNAIEGKAFRFFERHKRVVLNG